MMIFKVLICSLLCLAQINSSLEASTKSVHVDPFLKTLVRKLDTDRQDFIKFRPSRDEITLYMYSSKASVVAPAIIGGVLSIPALLLAWYAINQFKEESKLKGELKNSVHSSQCMTLGLCDTCSKITAHKDAGDKKFISGLCSTFFGLVSIPFLIAAYYNYSERTDKKPFMSFDSKGIKHFGKRVLYWEEVEEIRRESRTIPGTLVTTPFICYLDKNKISLFELFGVISDNAYDPNSPVTMKDLALIMSHYLAKYNPKFKDLA